MISHFSLICPLLILDNESFNVFNHRKFETRCCNCYMQKLFYPLYWSFTVLNFFEDFKDRAAFTLMISYAISVPDHAWQYLQLVFQPFLCIKKSFAFCWKRLLLHGIVSYSCLRSAKLNLLILLPLPSLVLKVEVQRVLIMLWFSLSLFFFLKIEYNF